MLQSDPGALFSKFLDFVSANMTMPEKDLEGCFYCLSILLRSLPGGVDESVQKMSQALSGPGRPELQLKIMGNVYSLLDFAPASRYALFLAMLSFAAANVGDDGTSLSKSMAGHAGSVEKWVAEWNCTPEQVIDVYQAALKVLQQDASKQDEAMAFLLKVLQVAEGGGAGAIAKVSAEAKLAVVTAIKTPTTFKCDELLDLASVQALSSDADGAKLVALLKIFVQEKVSAYLAFEKANAGFVEKMGLTSEICLDKMRLLSIVSLASEAESSEIAYSLVASTLNISTAGEDPNDELPEWVTSAEEWVIKAIAAGLIEARLDQRRRIIVVTRSTQREFQDTDWKALGATVGAWKDNVQRMLMVIESARETV